MAVRAVRGAIQVDADERQLIVEAAGEMITAVMERTAEFPAYAARLLGFVDVPLMCATEIAVEGAMPRVLRVLVHVETPLARSEIRHAYLRGAAALRRDLPT